MNIGKFYDFTINGMSHVFHHATKVYMKTDPIFLFVMGKINLEGKHAASQNKRDYSFYVIMSNSLDLARY